MGQKTEWHELYSLFPALEVIRGRGLVWFDRFKKMTTEEADAANVQIQALAQSCPRLRLILVAVGTRKAVIIRGGNSDDGVRWVVREWEDSEESCLKDGENVYGL
ncbi:hypothetical protein NLJ89_g12309 [Agrocybe chaxingu]|uniref:Uncharacterized protein n=1 Tax=Agrocybe chaxingu TaxID=84603 RepID=A0A9W8JV21_9AGAR|nr:hypothetical protein NLJ89_g12309 [Agrocybe chaxingu]